MKYSRQEIVRLIQRVINNEPCLDEWDDLLSIPHRDAFTEQMAQRLLAIQEAHSDFENGIMIDGKGVRKLEEILQELL